MSPAKARIVVALAGLGWYTIWGWIICGPLWDWTMPWMAFRWPLVCAVTVLTAWPLERWLTGTNPQPEVTP